jgi:hypothetical protein
MKKEALDNPIQALSNFLVPLRFESESTQGSTARRAPLSEQLKDRFQSRTQFRSSWSSSWLTCIHKFWGALGNRKEDEVRILERWAEDLVELVHEILN